MTAGLWHSQLVQKHRCCHQAFLCVRVARICGVGTLSLAAPSPLPECVVLPSDADTAHVDMYSPVTMTSDAAHENKRWSVGSGDVVHAWSVRLAFFVQVSLVCSYFSQDLSWLDLTRSSHLSLKMNFLREERARRDCALAVVWMERCL